MAKYNIKVDLDFENYADYLRYLKNFIYENFPNINYEQARILSLFDDIIKIMEEPITENKNGIEILKINIEKYKDEIKSSVNEMLSDILENNILSKDYIKVVESKVYIRPVGWDNQFLTVFYPYLPNLLKGYDMIKVKKLLAREKDNIDRYVSINGNESAVELFILIETVIFISNGYNIKLKI